VWSINILKAEPATVLVLTELKVETAERFPFSTFRANHGPKHVKEELRQLRNSPHNISVV
jgi:hypothetical protein